MRNLAREAGVAINTLYALFGPRREHVLEALVDDGLTHLDRMLQEREIDDPVAVGPALAASVVDYLLDNAEVFRPVFLARSDAALRTGSIGGSALGTAMGREALEAAGAEGMLRDDFDLDSLNEQIVHSFAWFARLWAARAISGGEFRDRVLYSIYLALAGVASDDARPRLHRALHEVERSLQKRRPRRAVGHGETSRVGAR